MSTEDVLVHAFNQFLDTYGHRDVSCMRVAASMHYGRSVALWVEHVS